MIIPFSGNIKRAEGYSNDCNSLWGRSSQVTAVTVISIIIIIITIELSVFSIFVCIMHNIIYNSQCSRVIVEKYEKNYYNKNIKYFYTVFFLIDNLGPSSLRPCRKSVSLGCWRKYSSDNVDFAVRPLNRLVRVYVYIFILIYRYLYASVCMWGKFLF